MSIIDNIERYMERYDHLIEKQTRRHNKGKTLSKEEDEELQKLRPTVLTPLTMMFELLFDTVKTNQEIRRNNGSRKPVQHGGRIKSMQEMENEMSEAQAQEAAKAAPATATPAATAAAAAAAAAAAEIILANSAVPGAAPPGTTAAPAAAPAAPAPAAAAAAATAATAKDDDDDDAKAKEAQRLSELEESLLPLLTKIIVYIEENKKAEKKKDGEPEEEKYPDIGTTAKNSAILVVRKIKKWWNDLIQGGSSDLSSKINLKKAIPQLPDNADDLNKMVDKATAAVHEPLQKIEKLLSNDVKDIASSSVEGIMNALSLIPGIGTTLQLWRLLQNVIVIMSKSVTTMAGAKTQGVNLKTNVQGLKGEMEKLAADKAAGAVGGAIPGAGAIPDAGALAGLAGGGGAGALAGLAGGGGGAGALAGLAGGGGAGALAGLAGGGGGAGALAGGGGGAGALAGGGGMPGMSGGAIIKHHTKSNRLRSIKKYKQEYKQSLREIRRTKKRIMKYFHNII
jgi:hypothetical protein